MATKVGERSGIKINEGNAAKRRKVNPRSPLLALLSPLTKKIIAGTSLPETLDTAEELFKKNVLFTLYYLEKDITDADEAKNAAKHYWLILKALRERGLEKQIQVKLSHLGLYVDENLCLENLQRIIKTAEKIGGFISVDIEDQRSIDRTIDIVCSSKKNRKTPIGIHLNANLKRSADDIMSLLRKEVSITLSTEEYGISNGVSYRDVNDIRGEFLSKAKRLLTSGAYHGIRTHDPFLVGEIVSFVKRHKISPHSFEFDMPYGIKEKLRDKLIRKGFRVRICLPFGRFWLPYALKYMSIKKDNALTSINNLFCR